MGRWIKKIVGALIHWVADRYCAQCGKPVRFREVDCPHCGHDLHEDIRTW